MRYAYSLDKQRRDHDPLLCLSVEHPLLVFLLQTFTNHPIQFLTTLRSLFREKFLGKKNQTSKSDV